MRNKNIPLLNPCRAGRVTVVLAAFLTALSALAEDGIIRNDTVWHDAAGREIWCNGGHIIQEGEVFYWVGYDTGPGRWPWRVNLYSSRNLGDWKFENTVIRMEGKFANLGWAGRPALLHCRTTGRYVIVFEADSPRQWKRHKVGFAVCDRIDGTYELENAESPEGTRSTGDQSVYQEGDRAYVVATLDKDIGGKKYLNQSLGIFELSKDFLRIERKVFEGFDNVSGDRNRVPRDHSSREASHIINVGGVYYWFSSALVGWNSSATMFSTATNLAGPWSELSFCAPIRPRRTPTTRSMILSSPLPVPRSPRTSMSETVTVSGPSAAPDATSSCLWSGKAASLCCAGAKHGPSIPQRGDSLLRTATGLTDWFMTRLNSTKPLRRQSRARGFGWRRAPTLEALTSEICAAQPTNRSSLPVQIRTGLPCFMGEQPASTFPTRCSWN